MARRQLIRRMIGASFSRAEEALVWAASRAEDVIALMAVARAGGPGAGGPGVREVMRHPVRLVRSALEGWPAARRAKRRQVPTEEPSVAPPPVERAEAVEPVESKHLPEPTDPEFRLEVGHARVTTTSRGRKTVPISVAAARKARAKVEPKPGIRPKHGQKKRGH